MNDITFLIKEGPAKPRRRYSKYRWIYEKIEAELMAGEIMVIENLESIKQASAIINAIRNQHGKNIEIHLDKNQGEDGFDKPYITLSWR